METEQAVEDNGIIGDALPHVTNDGKFHGRYPNSLLTLFYPFTLFRDVVLDQPVDPNDVPVSYYAPTVIMHAVEIDSWTHLHPSFSGTLTYRMSWR